MRQIVIDRIRASIWYQQCITNGLDVPELEKQTDDELLDIYMFSTVH